MGRKHSIKERFSNYGLWISIFALVGMILIDAKVVTDLGRYQEYVQIILVIMIGAGILNDPDHGKGYGDKEKLGD